MSSTRSVRLFGCGILTGAALTAFLTPSRGKVLRKRLVAIARRGRKQSARIVTRARRMLGPSSDFVRTVREHGVMAVVH